MVEVITAFTLGMIAGALLIVLGVEHQRKK